MTIAAEELGQGKGLFDRSQYDREDLKIAQVDGQQIDRIRLKLSGSVTLDRSEPADVELYNRLILGQEIELGCLGKVASIGTGWTPNRDGELEAVVGERTVKVDSVWLRA